MSDTILVVEEPEVTVVVAEDPTLVVVSAPGPQGPEGAPGPGSGSVVHNQTTAATVWTIPHGLGYVPNWYVVESITDAELDGSRSDPDVNTTVFDFGVLVSGTAYGS